MRKLLLLLLLSAACSIDKREAPGAGSELERNVPAQQDDSIQVTISAPHAAAVGDNVPISVVVQNQRNRPVDLHLTGREIVFDIMIVRPDSSTLWQRLQHGAVQQIVQLKRLQPREALTLYERWIATEPGTFIIGAKLPTDTDALVAEPVSIIIR